MNSLILAEGKNTPEIVFDPSQNSFSVKGNCVDFRCVYCGVN